MSPSLSTRMQSAVTTVDSRWATTIEVRPAHTFPSDDWMLRSVVVSNADVACVFNNNNTLLLVKLLQMRFLRLTVSGFTLETPQYRNTPVLRTELLYSSAKVNKIKVCNGTSSNPWFSRKFLNIFCGGPQTRGNLVGEFEWRRFEFYSDRCYRVWIKNHDDHEFLKTF